MKNHGTSLVLMGKLAIKVHFQWLCNKLPEGTQSGVSTTCRLTQVETGIPMTLLPIAVSKDRLGPTQVVSIAIEIPQWMIYKWMVYLIMDNPTYMNDETHSGWLEKSTAKSWKILLKMDDSGIA